MQLTHVRLLVEDFDVCFRFYRDVLGFTVTWGAEGDGYADFQGERTSSSRCSGRQRWRLSQVSLTCQERQRRRLGACSSSGQRILKRQSRA
jgi:hypothetical protein